ncbi:hypothetical protein G6F31_019306 [Rhizopus arrhizus]|nr:hypothetical protein G6F31_019306 [Rhizopus arrhizus]
MLASGDDVGLLAGQEIADMRDIVVGDRRRLVRPCRADEIDDVGDVLVAQVPEAGHRERHRVRLVGRHLAAFQRDLNDGLRVLRVHRRIARQRGENARHALPRPSRKAAVVVSALGGNAASLPATGGNCFR